jgi:ABC-type lipoprotein release transport system permease subunit
VARVSEDWAAVRLFAGRSMRSRWRGLVLLGVLGGLVGGLALAGFAGTGRTDRADSRYRASTLVGDAIIYATQVNDQHADYSAVLRLPAVIDGGAFALAPIAIRGHDDISSLPPADDQLFRTVDRPLLVAGRLPDPRRDDEILVNRYAASHDHIHVGDHLTLISSIDADAFASENPTLDGPTVAATVVGIGDSSVDQVFFSGLPSFTPSSGFLREHPQVPHPSNLIVRLRPGTDLTKFRQDAAAALGLPDVPVRDQADDDKRITHATNVDATALLLFTVAVVVAGLLVIAQAVGRLVGGMAGDAAALRALGFRRRGIVAALVLAISPAAAVASITAVVVAVILSARFPIGLAGRLDPDRGIHADWAVFVLGLASIVTTFAVAAAVAAIRASTVARAGRVRARPGSTTRLIGLGLPVAAALGVHAAFERRASGRSVPVRSALIGAVVAVLGTVGVFGLEHGINDAIAHPARSGQVWQAQATPADGQSTASAAKILAANASVSQVSAYRRVDIEVDGLGLPAYSISPVRGSMIFAVLSGRRPDKPGEIDVGPDTAKALHRHVGETVVIAGTTPTTETIVGLSLLPVTPHSSFDQGLWLDAGELDAISPPPSPDDGVLINLHAGFEANRDIPPLQAQLGSDSDIEPATQPADVLYLRDVRSLPEALAVFLILLGIAAGAHALLSSVGGRRRDLAILRALGFRPIQVIALVATQALTVALFAVAIGIPLGILAGRWSWDWIATAIPLVFAAPISTFAVAATTPWALLAAAILCIWPAYRAVAPRPGPVLRTE